MMLNPLTQTPQENLQFSEFRNIRTKLSRLQSKNKEEPLTENQLNKLQVLIDNANISSLKDRLLLLKLLSEKFFFGVDTLFYKQLEILRQSCPDIKQYMITLPDAQMFGPVLTPAGVSKLAAFYEKTYWSSQELLSCQPVSKLEPLVKQLQENYLEGKFQGWAVHADHFDGDKHFTPVFAICKNNAVHVFIFDSQGHSLQPQMSALSKSFHALQEWNWLRRSEEDCDVAEGFIREEERLPPVEIYSYSQKRQRGPVECSIYTLRDLKHLIEMHLTHSESIVDFYHNHPQHCTRVLTPYIYGIKGLPFYEIHNVIPAMMKATQSLSQIDQQAPDALSSVSPYSVRRSLFGGKLTEKNEDENTFYSDLNNSTFYNNEKSEQNGYIAKYRLKCFVYLLTSILYTDHEAADGYLNAQDTTPNVARRTNEISLARFQ